MGLFDTIKVALAGDASKAVGTVVDSLSNGIAKFVNTPEDKIKAEQILSDAKQTLQNEIEKHGETMQGLYEQQYNTQLLDVQNARQMEIALNQATSASSWLTKNIAAFLAIFVTLIWGSVTAYIILRVLALIAANPNVNMTILLGIYTGLTSIETIVLSYYFGSSSGSKAKDETIATIAKQN